MVLSLRQNQVTGMPEAAFYVLLSLSWLSGCTSDVASLNLGCVAGTKSCLAVENIDKGIVVVF
jgi:hypothetical protein